MYAAKEKTAARETTSWMSKGLQTDVQGGPPNFSMAAVAMAVHEAAAVAGEAAPVAVDVQVNVGEDVEV